jgi:hypothetical protein
MPYVIKAVSTSGVVIWLTRPDSEGFRSIGTRSRADVLSTAEDAAAEIARMPQVFKDAGIKFSVVEIGEKSWTGAARLMPKFGQRESHAIRGKSQ